MRSVLCFMRLLSSVRFRPVCVGATTRAALARARAHTLWSPPGGHKARPYIASASKSPPHLVSQFHHQAQLRPLLLLGQHIALLGRGEAALRAQAELVVGDVFLRLGDAALDVV